MRLLAIGDIHGCRKALDALLETVNLAPDDLLVTLGDYVDRGDDSMGVIDRLLELRRTRRVVCLRGNHEVMMQMGRESVDSAPFWLRCGGRETLQSYPQPSLDAVPDSHWRFMDDECLPLFETEKHVFVHAGLDPVTPLDAQTDDYLYWEKLNPSQAVAHESGKVMVCGHTEQRDGVPLNLGFAVCIDTWAYAGVWLTCLDVNSTRYWQANNLGQTRTGWLTESHD